MRLVILILLCEGGGGFLQLTFPVKNEPSPSIPDFSLPTAGLIPLPPLART